MGGLGRMYVYVHMCTYGGQRSRKDISSVSSYLFNFELGSHLAWSSLIGSTGLLKIKKNKTLGILLSLIFSFGIEIVLALFMGFGDPNYNPHTCVAALYQLSFRPSPSQLQPAQVRLFLLSFFKLKCLFSFA